MDRNRRLTPRVPSTVFGMLLAAVSECPPGRRRRRTAVGGGFREERYAEAANIFAGVRCFSFQAGLRGLGLN